MNKYKVCIYAICKDEEKNIKEWFNSVKEADDIYVLDTGSKDNSVNLLKKLGVNVKIKNIKPWRFDVARNESLKMVPEDTDICVCVDLDERFNKGWRKELENTWEKNNTKLRYTYNWKLTDSNIPLVSFLYDKIHSRNDYIWTHPVHEVLTYIKSNPEKIKTNDKIILNHYPDIKKSRSSYLSLLELSVKEDPFDDRNLHYLGREYMYHSRWNDAIDTLIKHLNLNTSLWKDERCASMRFIARCYKQLNRFDEAKMWLNKAIVEAPNLRDPYVEMAFLEYSLNNYSKSKEYLLKALKIKEKKKTYINEVFSWDHTIYDLLSILYFYENEIDKALFYLDIAINKCNDKKEKERLLNNKKIIRDFKLL